MKSSKIYAIAGQIGSGKTTYGRKLAKEKKAIFFSIDQWIAELGVTIGSYEVYSQYYPGCRSRIREIAIQALDLGVSVVFDFGVNQARGRKGLKEFADTIDAALEIHHLNVPLDICKERVRERNKNKPQGIYSFHFSEDDFDFVAKNYDFPTSDEKIVIVEAESTVS